MQKACILLTYLISISISISQYFVNIVSVSYRNWKSDIEALLEQARFAASGVFAIIALQRKTNLVRSPTIVAYSIAPAQSASAALC